MKPIKNLVQPWLWSVFFVLSTTAIAQEATTGDAVAPEATVAEGESAAPTDSTEDLEGFPPDQIEQLAAPVALYPDALLAQVLMASTYPLDIVQAARWVEDQGDLEGEALQEAVEQESWDPSVQALVFFPGVLENMNRNLGWTQDLGEAYLGQEDDVMSAVQRLREEAYEAGNLETNEQQQVEVEGDTIVVQPADPDVVYVPSYNPATVYAQPVPTTTYYPTVYEQSSGIDGVSFATGALVGGLLTAAIMWDRNDNWCCGVYYGGPGRCCRGGYWGRPGYWGGGWRRPVNIDRNVNIRTGDITVNRGNKVGKWQHNPTHRGNINYKNKKTKAKYSRDLKRGPVDRDVARGYKRDGKGSAGRDRQRPGSKQPGGAKRPASADRKQVAKRDGKQVQRRDANLKRPEKAKTRANAQQRPAAKPQGRDARKPQSRPQTRDVKKPQTRPRSRRRALPACRSWCSCCLLYTSDAADDTQFV